MSALVSVFFKSELELCRLTENVQNKLQHSKGHTNSFFNSVGVLALVDKTWCTHSLYKPRNTIFYCLLGK